jgi:hypothetical protein
MRCLIVVLLVLAAMIGAVVAAWMWYGWWGLLGVFVGGFVLLWLLARFGPGASAVVFRGMFAALGESMKEAKVTVHSIEPAADLHGVDEVLREMIGWLQEQVDEEGPQAAYLDFSEYLSHSEVDMDFTRFLIEVTVTPPQSDPPTKWAPHALSLASVEGQGRQDAELIEIEEFDAATGQFGPLKDETAFEETAGERRLRLRVAVDPGYRDYRFTYAFETPLDATVTLPDVEAAEPRRLLAEGILDRIERFPAARTLNIDYLPLIDADLPRLQRFTQLEFLGLQATNVTSDGIAHIAELSSLQQLVLDNTPIDDSGLVHLARLPNLQRLFVRDTAVTSEGIERLKQSIPGLKVYSGSGNPFRP